MVKANDYIYLIPYAPVNQTKVCHPFGKKHILSHKILNKQNYFRNELSSQNYMKMRYYTNVPSSICCKFLFDPVAIKSFNLVAYNMFLFPNGRLPGCDSLEHNE